MLIEELIIIRGCGVGDVKVRLYKTTSCELIKIEVKVVNKYSPVCQKE